MYNKLKRLTQKSERLSKEQLIPILDSVIAENESLYAIFDSLTTGLLIVDEDFKLKQNNTIVESLISFNTYLDDINADEVPLWELINDDEISNFLKKCHSKKITNSTEEFSVITNGGSTRFITITLLPFVLQSKLSGTVILIRDITEKKNQEIMLHRMENMAGLTNLAAGMAHDIKNPLGAISIHIQLVQKALEKARENQNVLPDKKFVEDHIDVVNNEIDHLNRLVMDFLFAVRPINANLTLSNPAKVIQNVISFIEPEFNDSKIKINFVQNDSDLKILIDEKLLKEAVMNLAQNALAAIKSANKGDGILDLECQLKDNKYLIIIRDNGCGMDDKTVAKIFEPYFTTKSNGTGLGMTMVYKIIKEFSGDIQVESVPGEGTEFKIVLPVPQKDKLAIEN